MEHVVYFIVSFAISYFGRCFLYKKSKKTSKRKNKKNRSNLAIEFKYLSSKFALDREKLDTLKMARIVSLLDAVIISVTFTVVSFITDMWLVFILGIVIVFGLIFGLYEVLGSVLKRKGFEKK